ncbi:phage tail protein [Enterobacter pseudoroggenkampii]|uniref:phage tail protein n=1 Tax=Enterobacter pseudoroggenkampii TaxID=2996112 RepID=UPI002263FBDF|nr:phage tail protein [Enterobacter pseudoroggenkampii]MCX8288288.1 phage tail protein [Enterobacter pseudoroggenkampii]
MAEKYYSILTNRGKELEAQSSATGKPVIIKDFVVGDGNGQSVIPDPALTTLVHEVYRSGISALQVSPDQANQFFAQIVLPADVGGFVVREVGLLTDAGELYAVANCAAIEKPVSGISVKLQFRLAVSETADIELKIATGDGLFLRQDANLGDVKDVVESRKNIGLKGAAILDVGTTQNTVAAGDDSRIVNALQKEKNLSDLTDADAAKVHLGLGSIATKSKDEYILKSGDSMEGPLGLTQTSSFGVGTKNTIGGSSIAIGDNDSGFKSNGDGIIGLMANSVLAGYFNEDELQHSARILTKIFQIIEDNNGTAGAGGLGAQLTSGAPFLSPAIVRPNNDNNYFPLVKQVVSLASGYPVAFSVGLMTTGEPNFPQVVIHAKTDFDVNDRLWVLDVATGEFRSPATIKAGGASLHTNGDITGSVWGGELTNWLNSQFASRDENIKARATTDWVNNSFNKKNTATMGFSGWSRDESTGLIMQWGNVDKANGTYSFPRAFIDTCFAVFATNKDGQLGAIDNAYGYPVSTTQFRLASKANSGEDTACGISWFALGY